MKFSGLFCENAVLQQNTLIPVWGEARPVSKIAVRLGGVSAYCFSSAAGEWSVRLPAPAAGGPYTLEAEEVSGGGRISVENIYVGEVWLCSGQSNMAFRMEQSPQISDFVIPDETVCPVSFFTVAPGASSAVQKNPAGTWQRLTMETLGKFPAVAAWFAKNTVEKLRVPVGIITAALGGTRIEAWTSRNTLMRDGKLRLEVLEMEKSMGISPVWDMPDGASIRLELLKTLPVRDCGNEGVAKGYAAEDFDDSAWMDYSVPGDWIQQGIAGNGVIWARRRAEIPSEWEGRDILLSLGNIDKQDIAYFNGVEVGRCGKDLEEKFWNVKRLYRIPGRLVKSGSAVVAVRGFSFISDGGFGGMPEDYTLAPADAPEEKISLAGSWKAFPEKDFGIVRLPMGYGNANSYSILFNEMIRPLIPYAVSGVIWYQGEENTHTVGEASEYEQRLRDLISDWRWWWGQGDLPFYIIQLANYRSCRSYEEKSAWAYLRESQRRVCRDTAEAELIVITDCGEASDIHPKNKRTVGERTAAKVLYHTYGQYDVIADAPEIKHVRQENGGLRLFFANASGGLGGAGDFAGSFRIAGNDGRFFAPEIAEISGGTVFIKTPEVAFPVAVRFNWADNPGGVISGTAGLPASPFEATIYGMC